MIPCGGKCGDPNCQREFKDQNGLNGHVGGRKATHAKSPTTAAKTPPPVSPGFYPPLADWKPSQSTGPAAGASSPPAPGPIFDSSGLWLGLGRILDETILKDKPSKINMTEARAKALDASIQQIGWKVEAPASAVVIPYWLPFVITAVGTFAIPVALAFLPAVTERFKGATSRLRNRGKEAAGETPPSNISPSQPPPSKAPEPAPPSVSLHRSMTTRAPAKYAQWWGGK